jgi:hypothetical protein
MAMEPTEFFTLLLAGATVVLAGATVWLGFEARWTRDAEAATRHRVAFQAALLEQVENCQTMRWRNPGAGADALLRLNGSQPSFGAARALLSTTTLPRDVAAYLVWTITRAEELDGQFQRSLRLLAQSAEDKRVNVARGAWDSLLEHLQVLGCLLYGECRRQPELHEVAATFAAETRWFTPQPRPESARVLQHAEDHAQLGAPDLPAGTEYAACTPTARDAGGAATLERQREFLADPGQRLMRRLRGRR